MNERALVEMTFPGIACWVALARRWATDALMAAGHQDLDSVRLVTSELVGNAVVHTRSGRPGGLVTVKVVEVGDALARSSLPWWSRTPYGSSGSSHGGSSPPRTVRPEQGSSPELVRNGGELHVFFLGTMRSVLLCEQSWEK
jgi:hypothetical protein